MEELNKIFQHYLDQKTFPGIQWSIYKDGKYLSGKLGFSNIETLKEIEDDTIYRIFSMTKPIIAIVTMQLVEKKLINLDDPIDKYLIEFQNLKVMKNNKESISDIEDLKIKPTIKNLLQHTAGFSYGFLPDALAAEYTKQKLFNERLLSDEIKLLSKFPLYNQPMTEWRYSVCIDVLARILEVVLNKKLQNILKDNIFDPLDMQDTGFSLDNKKSQRLMTLYQFDSQSKKLIEEKNPQDYPINSATYARGGHGLYSTIKDYNKFCKMLLNGKSDSGVQIISEKTLNLIIKNTLPENLLPMKIEGIDGLSEEGDNGLEPYGWGLGFRTMLFPEKNKNIGEFEEFGWAGAASTYFLVDIKNNLFATLMTHVLNGERKLNVDFYEFIYSTFLSSK